MKKLLIFVFITALFSIDFTPINIGKLNSIVNNKQFQLSDLGAKLLAHFPDARTASNLTLESGSKVSNWIETVNNKPFAQTTDSRRPIYQNSEIVFNEGAETTHGLTSSFTRSGTDICFFMVMRNLSYQDNRYVLHCNGSQQFIIRQTDPGNIYKKIGSYLSSGAIVNYGNFLSDNDYHIFCIEKKDTTVDFIRDINNFTDDMAANTSFNFTAMFLGNNNNYNFHTKIAVREIIITTGALTKAEKFNVINLLNKNYSIASGKINKASSYLFDQYLVSSNTVVPDTEGGVNQANTGLCYDSVLGEIYVVETPRAYIKVYNTSFEYLREFAATVGQGLAKDHINNVFYSWNSYGTNALTKMNSTGGIIWQQNFDPFSGVSAGQIALDFSETNLVLWAASSGQTSIKKYTLNPGTDRFEFTASVSVVGGEGIAWDSRTNTLWVHQNENTSQPSTLCNITKTGTILKTYSCKHHGEGIAVNATKGVIYSNHPTFYHGGTVNGNVCDELYPEYLSQ